MKSTFFAGYVICSLVQIGCCSLTFTIQPQSVKIGDTITLNCSLDTPKSESEFLRIAWPGQLPGQSCTFDCLQDEACYYDIDPGSCKCDSTEPNVDEVCPDLTKSVSYTVSGVTTGMSGDWVCRFETSENATYFLQVYDLSDDPYLEGNFNTTITSSETFTCTSMGGFPPAQFEWFIGDGSNITDEATPGNGSSTLLYSAQRDDNGKNITCIVKQLEGMQQRIDSHQLNILYGGEVEVGPCRLQHIVEEEKPLNLLCNVTRQGNPPVYSYVWHFNGELTGITSQWYNTSQSQLSNIGNYSCSAVNGIEEGKISSHLMVQVLYHPRNVNVTGSTLVVEGNPLSLTCYADARPNIIDYGWSYPTGSQENQTLNIESTTYKDAGMFTCTAENEFQACGGNVQRNGDISSVNVIVQYTPKGEPVASITDSTISIEKSYTLYCDLSTLNEIGVPDASWIAWHSNRSFLHNYTIIDGTTNWEDFVPTSVKESGIYHCIAGNFIGPSNSSKDIDVIVEAPVSFEEFKLSMDNPVYNGTTSSDFNLSCVISASNINTVYIKKNDKQLDERYFGTETNDIACENGCNGLSKAHKLESYWKASEHQFDTCEGVVYYDSVYQCVATATTAGEEETKISNSVIVETHYAAIWNSDKKYQAAEFEELNVVLQCPVCANPMPNYQWYFNGTDTASQISGATMKNYTVAFTNDSTFGFYYCEVNNTVGTVAFPLELRELGPAESPTDLYILPNMTSSSLTVQWKEGRSGNMPPVIYTIKSGEHSQPDCNPDTSFQYIQTFRGSQEGIEGTHLQVLVERLQPHTEYCIRIHGENQRTGINTTNEYVCSCDSKTTGLPDIKNVQIDSISSSEMIITWDYNQQRSERVEVAVGLKFNYSAEGTANSHVYPVNGTVNATQERVTIPDEFDDKASYSVSVQVYEGNNQMATFVQGIDPPIYRPDGVNIGAIIGPLIAILVIIVVVGLVVFHRNKLGINKLFRKEGQERLNSGVPDKASGEENAGFDDAFAMSGYADVDQKLSGENNDEAIADTAAVTYAEVDKSKKKNKHKVAGDAYAQVDKKTKKKKGAPVTPTPETGDNPYDDVQSPVKVKPTIAAKPKLATKPIREVSEDGCVYIKVDFPKYSPQTSGNIIHGKDQMTVYTQIDWTRTPEPVGEQAEPPPYRQEEEDVMGTLPPPRDEDV